MRGVGKLDYEPSSSSIFYLLWSMVKQLSQVPFIWSSLTCSPVESEGDPCKRHDCCMLCSWNNTSSRSFLVYRHLNLCNYNIISVGISISVILTSWLAIFLQWHFIFHCNSTTVTIMICVWKCIFCWISNFLLWVPLLDQHAEQKHVSPDQEQNSMLKVICNQRDRFRARLRETEEVCSFYNWDQVCPDYNVTGSLVWFHWILLFY